MAKVTRQVRVVYRIEKYHLFPFDGDLPYLACAFNQVDDSNWLLNISMSEVKHFSKFTNAINISVQLWLNIQTIPIFIITWNWYHPVAMTLKMVSLVYKNLIYLWEGLIYRYEPNFSMSFDCYMHREASFSSDGWTIVSSNTNITSGKSVNENNLPQTVRFESCKGTLQVLSFITT